MEDTPELTAPQPAPATIFTPHRRTQTVVVLASILCSGLCWQAAKWTDIPPVPRFDGSLLAQPHWPLAILATWVMLLGCVAIGTVLAGWSWFFAGQFTGAVALVTLSVRCGAEHFVLFGTASGGDVRGTFLRLLAEQCLLFLVVGMIWYFFWRRFDAAVPRPQADEAHSSPLSSIAAVVAEIVLMGLLVLLLAPTDVKKQVVVSVFIAAFLGAMLGEYLFPNRKAGGWYWLGPFVVGAVGYVAAGTNAAAYIYSAAWTMPPPNTVTPLLTNLAHPLPLDYAGAGIAGALLGYWLGAERPHAAFFSRRAASAAKNPDSTPPAQPR